MADNLKKASKASQFQNKIDQLGSLGTSTDEFIFELSSLESVTGDFIEEIKERIQAADIVTTGKIEDISMKIEDNHVYLYGSEHLIYVDRGTRGAETSDKAPDSPHFYSDKMPPPSAFAEWLARKNINLRNNEFFYGKPSPFEDLTDEELIKRSSWGIAKNRQKHGSAPVPVFEKFIPDYIDKVKQVTKSTVKANIISTIKNRFNQDIFNKKK
ncbi:hypothetical protein [Pedobacter aquatilis]|uniref:hypothetical protein n=1 Tax=Pedobacter aquatilis TaxID=351343 RepID=UPI0029304A40|nr:hypothetical protein [Pedobacter aquatilis]